MSSITASQLKLLAKEYMFDYDRAIAFLEKAKIKDKEAKEREKAEKERARIAKAAERTAKAQIREQLRATKEREKEQKQRVKELKQREKELKQRVAKKTPSNGSQTIPPLLFPADLKSNRPRSPSGYNLYVSTMLPSVKASLSKHDTLAPRAAMSEVSQRWKNLSEAQRDAWKTRAASN